MVSIHIALEIIELVIGTCNYPNQADDKIDEVDQGKICGETDKRGIAASKSMNTDSVTPIVKNTRESTETNNEMDGVVSDNQVRSTELKESDISAKPKVRKHVASIHSTTNVNATLKDDGRATELKEGSISAKPKVRNNDSKQNTTSIIPTARDNDRVAAVKSTNVNIVKLSVRSKAIGESTDNLMINNPHSGINISSVKNKHKVKYTVRNNNLTNDIFGMRHRKKRKRRRCRYCGEWNHNKYECRYESPLTCHLCDKLGHKMKFCHEYY